MSTAIATSSGELIDRAFVTTGERQRVVALQRRLSRCAKRSANRNKVRAELAAVQRRGHCRRQDFCAQTAHGLASANAVVVVARDAQNGRQLNHPRADVADGEIR